MANLVLRLTYPQFGVSVEAPQTLSVPLQLALRGAAGADGDPGAAGDPGADGASAYEVAVANGFVGNEAAWLASLQGADGDPGPQGDSAYEVAVANGFVGSEAAWLASLQGADGDPGPTGPAGPAPSGTGYVKVAGGVLQVPSVSIPAADVTQDSTHRFATDAEKSAWDSKQAALGYTAADDADLQAHIDDTANPHAVTAAQAGAIALAALDTDTTLAANSDVLVSSQKAVKAYADSKEASANKDASAGYVGKTLENINFWNAARTFMSFFTNAATAARTWTFPDKDGTVAMTSDITGTNTGTNTGDQTSIVGITGTIAQFNTACTDADFVSTGANTFTAPQAIALGTITSAIGPLSLTETRNASGVTFPGLVYNITNTAAAAASKVFDFQLSATSVTYLKPTGVWGTTFNGGTSAFVVEVSGQNAVGVGRNGSLGGLSTFEGSTAYFNVRANEVSFNNSASLGWWSGGMGGGNLDTIMTRSAAATLQHGAANAASPVAQTVQAQGSRSGTDSNVGGANFTIQSGQGTGTGTASSLIFKTPVTVASGSGAQTMTTALTLNSGKATFAMPMKPAPYTNATEPSWINGEFFFNTDLDKLRVGGASAWETVTSS